MLNVPMNYVQSIARYMRQLRIHRSPIAAQLMKEWGSDPVNGGQRSQLSLAHRLQRPLARRVFRQQPLLAYKLVQMQMQVRDLHLT